MSDNNKNELELSGIDFVIKNLLEKYPVSLPLLAAGKFVNLHTASAVYTSRSRGQFPLKISEAGGHAIVFTHDIIDFLRTGKSQANKNQKKIKNVGTGRGRPNKTEQVEAARLGLSVAELRAQSQIGGL